MEMFLDGKCLLPVTSNLLEASILRGMENSCASFTCDEPLSVRADASSYGRGREGRKERGNIKPLKTLQTKSGELDQVFQQPPCGRHWVHFAFSCAGT